MTVDPFSETDQGFGVQGCKFRNQGEGLTY